MIPKLTILATSRSERVSVAGSLPSTSAAVARVDVLPTLERLAQDRLAGDVGEDAQLDLAVVGREQPVTLLGDERRADLAAQLGPDRDRLQVRVRRREPPGRRDGLVEGRVEPAVALARSATAAGGGTC